MENTLKRTSEDKKNKVIELYNSGLSQIQIEKDLKMTRKTIRTILKQSGCEYRDKSEAFRNRHKGELNQNAFDNLNEESLYWIGFLYADGHLAIDNSIQIALKNEDEDHLKKFLEFLGSNARITSCNKGKAKRVRIYSKQLSDRLRYFGFDNNKSSTAVPHEELKNSRDFWRGVIDGDGCISKLKGYSYIHLCGTYKTIEEFIRFLNKESIPWKASGKELYQIGWISENGRDVANLLYKDSKIYLDRKYKKYKEYFEN